MDRTPSIVVVGGGIAGCAVAAELAARGAPVTVVERGRPGGGATGASAGMLAPQYEAGGRDAVFDFALACRAAWPAFAVRLEELSGTDVGYRTDGMLVANRTPAEDAAARAALAFQESVGLRGRLLEPDEAAALHPDVTREVSSWLWLPDEGQVDAQRLASVLGDAVRRAGGRVEAGAEAVALLAEGGRVRGVRLGDGRTLAADRVVLAAGAWSAGIDGLPRALPVAPVRGQMLRLLPDEPLPPTLVADHASRYLVPRDDGSVLVGATMEEVGFDDAVTEEGRADLARAAESLVPGLDGARVAEAWAGLRPMTPDRRPVLGPDPDLEGLIYATGHGRNGILFAPLVGRSVADLATAGASDVAWEAFRVERFEEARA